MSIQEPALDRRPRVKTRRAEIIDACDQAAEECGLPIIGQMPRMAEFYRKRVNEQLRAARVAGDADSAADARAKLELLRWTESWLDGPLDKWPRTWNDAVAASMNAKLAMIGYTLQHLVRAYANHPQFRAEWS